MKQKYKPKPEHPALNEFAHGDFQNETASKVVEELQQIDLNNPEITDFRIMMLREGLTKGKENIDGWENSYQLLLPFITLGCLIIEREERAASDKLSICTYLAAQEALEDSKNMIAVTELQGMAGM